MRAQPPPLPREVLADFEDDDPTVLVDLDMLVELRRASRRPDPAHVRVIRRPR